VVVVLLKTMMADDATSALCIELCVHCFDVALGHLNEAIPPPLVAITSAEKFPLFVTWKKRTSTSTAPRLRGCIGTFTAKPLSVALGEYAVISAFRDGRFAPVHAAEVPTLSVAVSLLVNFTPTAAWDYWSIGQHGINIEFTDGGHSYSGTYLPEVAADQGWDHHTTIMELMAKCGWRSGGGGTINDIKRRMRVVRYESVKSSLSHSEYVDWKRARSSSPATVKVQFAMPNTSVTAVTALTVSAS